jgi:hypothetical protein
MSKIFFAEARVAKDDASTATASLVEALADALRQIVL